MKIVKMLFFGSLFLSDYTLSSQCLESGGRISEWKYTSSSGYSEIDQLIKEEYTGLTSLFQVSPFVTILENDLPPNAYFTTSCPNSQCDGTVAIGKNLIATLYESKTISGVIAHEFAHCLQAKFQCSLKSKELELHADYLAGYYIGSKNYFNEQSVSRFASTFFKLGDHNFSSPDHHGTPDERSCAFIEGFRAAHLIYYDVYTAYSYGIEYVSINRPCNNLGGVPNRIAPLALDKVLSGGITITANGSENLAIFNSEGKYVAPISRNQPYSVRNLKPGNYSFIIKKKTKLGWIKTDQPIPVPVMPGKTTTYTMSNLGIYIPLLGGKGHYSFHFE